MVTDTPSLFDMTPPKKPKEVPPAYRPGRVTAQRLRDDSLAKYAVHQQKCGTCVPLTVATLPVGRCDMIELAIAGKLCTQGSIAVWTAVKFERGLRVGYYPDHHARESKPTPTAPAFVQPSLSDG